MATIEQETKKREELEGNLNELASITPDSLIRKAELGTALSFEEGLPYFKRTLKLFSDLSNSKLDGISHTALNQLNTAATQAFGEFKSIKDFSIEQHPQNTKDARDQLINTIRDRYDHYYQILTPHIAYSIRKGTDFEALEKNARETLSEVFKIKEKLNEEQLKAKKEATDILESMRKAAAEVGVSQHAIYFKEAAEEHKNASDTWFSYTKWMAFSTIIFAVLATIAFFFYGSDLRFEQAIQLAVAKILVFSVFYYATIWCGKNYRAYLHNYVVNKHRQNGLSTFQAFVKATEDEATKNAVLLRSTESIFGMANSGFISSDTEQSSSSQILEIIRSGFEAKGGKVNV